MKSLVIVESPTKRNTIGKYLKDVAGEYTVEASVGHIRDLANRGKGGLGVDIENDFKPTYIIKKDKAEVVKKLTVAKRKHDEVILATDPDREGEAIAWHLAEVLGLDAKTTKRIEFHEITRDSIQAAMAAPRTIDMDMKASQETRRIIDRISGFKLSKLLQKKIKSRSAGRVQSVALKFIVDREREIEAFVPEEYWTIAAELGLAETTIPLTLKKVDDKKVELHYQADADAVLKRLGPDIALVDIKQVTRLKEPRPPFKTSTLQQEAFAKFRFSTKRTNALASTLYEGVSLGDEVVGLITYMRTDATRLSESYINRAHHYIKENYGERYIAPLRRVKAGLLAQDAHEAIRPTGNHRTPDSLIPYLKPDQLKLYALIYNRALASLMPDKVEQVTTYTFETNGVQFTAEGVVTVFDGFTKLYQLGDEEERQALPPLSIPSRYPLVHVSSKQNFTKPPVRFSEAKMVEEMEKNGIGRPSTYSATIETLKARDYITAKAGVLTPTKQGRCTVEYLELFFTDFINPLFTANMEKQLDEVEDGNHSSTQILQKFYQSIEDQIGQAGDLPRLDQCQQDFGPCPECGTGRLVERKGPYGLFIGCNRFPACKYIQKKPKAVPEKIGRLCPLCGHELVKQQSKKKGKPFIACSAFPKCRYIEPIKGEPKDE